MIETRPLIRITIGPVRREGFESLRLSVVQLKTLYPECDIVVCHNQLSPYQISQINGLNVELVNQHEYSKDTPICPKPGLNVHWKLYPLRLRPNAHEIFIDNDIIISKRIREIDFFLNNNAGLLYEGLHRLYGRFEKYVSNSIRINSGIFGLPPNFDFHTTAEQIFSKIQAEWKDNFDEQGLVASCILSLSKYYIIPQTTIPIIEPWMNLDCHLRNPSVNGFHFVGLNRHDHPEWHHFRHIRNFL